MIKILVTILLLMPSIALAVPSVSSVSGSFTHGQTVIISGSGFGIKSPVAPAKYDPVTGMYPSIVDGATVPLGMSSGHPWDAVSGSEGDPPVFNTVDHREKTTATYSNKGSLSGSGVATVGGFAVPNCGNGGYLYLSYWIKPHADLSASSNSKKLWRLDDAINGEDTITYILQVGPSDGAQYDVYSPSICTAGGGYCYNNWDGPTWTTGLNQWYRLETWVHNNTNHHPTTNIYRNGVAAGAGSVSQTVPDICTIAVLGADYSNGAPPQPQIDFGEIYVDSTLARVEVCSGSTWAAKGHCEIQIPTTQWVDSTLQANVNQGSFADNSTAYLYVLDSTGTANSSGKLITFGSSSSDTTAPVITAFTIPATASSLTVSVTSFTATDDTGITGYCINESSSAPTSSSCSGSGWAGSAQSSYTFTSYGTKTLYGWAKDAAGNISTGSSSNITLRPLGSQTGGSVNGSIMH